MSSLRAGSPAHGALVAIVAVAAAALLLAVHPGSAQAQDAAATATATASTPNDSRFTQPDPDDVCSHFGGGMATGPVQAGLNEGKLGTGRRACGRSEVGLGLGLMLVVEPANFYGRLSAGGALDGSVALGKKKRIELFGTLEFLRAEILLAPIGSSSFSLGNTTLGATWRFLAKPKATLGLTGKVVLPTAFGLYKNAWPFGVDLGVNGQFAINPRVQFHGQAGGLFSAAASKGASQPRIGAFVTAGTELRPGYGFAFVADVYASFGYTAPLDVLAAALSLRFSDARRFGFQIGATIPIVGRERAAARADFRVSVRLGKVQRRWQGAPDDMPGHGVPEKK